MNFEKQIKPFWWNDSNGSFSVCLNAGDYKPEIFESREDEGCEGNGYDWEALARVFLEEKCEELLEDIEFDSEAGMFCAYSEDSEALKKFVLAFKDACEDSEFILDLFSRAEID